MDDGKQVDLDRLGVELASVARVIVFLRAELEALDRLSAAAQLYLAVIGALESVYRLQRSD